MAQTDIKYDEPLIVTGQLTRPTDWQALFLEERAKNERLTDALVALKSQGFSPPFEPKQKPPTDNEPRAVRLSPLVAKNLGKLEATIRSHLPPDTPDDVIHAEAVRVAQQGFPE